MRPVVLAGVRIRVLIISTALLAFVLTVYGADPPPFDSQSTAFVQQTSSLLAAFRNQSIRTIVLTSDYDVGHDFDPSKVEPPVPITRNVTLTGLPGQMPLLNLRFQRAALELCAGCIFVITDCAIASERRGNGAAVDFFVGTPGSSEVQLRNAYRVRPVCTSTDSTIELIHKDQKRNVRHLSPNGTEEQWLGRENVIYRGKTYIDMLWLIDFSNDVPLSYQEGKGMVGGYILVTINTTRLCDHLVAASCLAVKSPEVCVNELIDQVAAEQAGGAQQLPSNLWLIAVVVPAAVAAAAALLLWRRRRNRQRQQAEKLPSCSSQGTPGDAACMDTEKGIDPTNSITRQPLLDVDGWQVTSKSTTPALGAMGDCKIQFGVLLGAGSFGRVYKGIWAGRDVAVKIIDHDSESAPAVENEVQLMMSLNHPNVVRAYHYVSYKHTATDMDSNSAKLGPVASCTDTVTDSGNALVYTPKQRQQLQSLQKQQRQLQQLVSKPSGSFSQDSNGGLAGAGCLDALANPTPSADSTPISKRRHFYDSLTDSSHALSDTGTQQLSTEMSTGVQAQQTLLQQQMQDQFLHISSSGGHMQQGSDIDTNKGAVNMRISSGSGHTLTHDQILQLQQHVQQQQQQVQLQLSASSTGPTGHMQLSPTASTAAIAPAAGAATATAASSAVGAAAGGVDGGGGGGSSAAAAAATGASAGGQTLSPARSSLAERDSRADGNDTHRNWPGIVDSPADRSALAVGSGRERRTQAKTWLVQEYCDMGTLSSLTFKLSEPADDQGMLRLLLLLQDAARGLSALHSKSIVHGDLNARNVLVTSSPTAPFGVTAKLADLGLSRVIKQHTHRTTMTTGTMSHSSPELLCYGRMSTAVDVYAFGVMMWELWTGQIAFKKLHYGQFFEFVVLRDCRPPVPPHMPQEYALLMTHCWTKDLSIRPSIDAVLGCLQLLIQQYSGGSSRRPADEDTVPSPPLLVTQQQQQQQQSMGYPCFEEKSE